MIKGLSLKSAGKKGFINKWYWGKCAAIWRKVKLDPYLTLYTRTNSIWVKYMFQYKHKVIRMLDENMDKFLYNTGIGKAFLTGIQKSYMKTMVSSII